jgi:tryptophan synthase alpha chain
LGLKNPKLIGFGISNKKGFDKACESAQGAIIGSAFITALSGNKPVVQSAREFISSVLHG